MTTSKKNSLSRVTKILSFLGGLALFAVIFVPIWKIELDAPQYPEGLELKIHADKLAGQVDIINGLNHYIGMRHLSENDFIEFQFLPYIFAILGFFGVLTAIINRKWFFYIWGGSFIAFAIAAMVDFYMWLYNYGHNLDPTAPIQVPGMTYQPPLLGFKQLLNFGAYSIPDIGGWIMAGVGVLIVFCGFIEIRKK
ncbi:MAG: hypothetical protein M0R38_01050 [Bacteroidia bacterium]|nr:hypothetical protein [Bacteroidia bacterium]